jgi:hypothetical protein
MPSRSVLDLQRDYTPLQRALIDVVFKTKFSVEERDYYGGQRNCGGKCPVSLAIRRAMGTHGPVSVCAATIRIDSVWFVTPKEVDAYIKAYDRRDEACFLLDFTITELT